MRATGVRLFSLVSATIAFLVVRTTIFFVCLSFYLLNWLSIPVIGQHRRIWIKFIIALFVHIFFLQRLGAGLEMILNQTLLLWLRLLLLLFFLWSFLDAWWSQCWLWTTVISLTDSILPRSYSLYRWLVFLHYCLR